MSTTENNESNETFSEIPSEDQLSELRKMFIDVVKYGKPRRDIQGIRTSFSPSVNDSLSPTILILKQTKMCGKPICQLVSWAPDDDVVTVRGSWEKIEKQIESKLPLHLVPAGNENTLDKNLKDFAYGLNLNIGKVSMDPDSTSRNLAEFVNPPFGMRWYVVLEIVNSNIQSTDNSTGIYTSKIR